MLFFVGSLVLFLKVDADTEPAHNPVNPVGQNVKRSRYFDEYEADPHSDLLASELATSSQQDRDNQNSESTTEKITSFIKKFKNKVQGGAMSKSPEELEKNPFTKSDAASNQQSTTTQIKDNISIRIPPNASKKFFTFLFVILAIAGNIFRFQFL